MQTFINDANFEILLLCCRKYLDKTKKKIILEAKSHITQCL